MTTLNTQTAQPNPPSSRARTLTIVSLSIICALSSFWPLKFISENEFPRFILAYLPMIVGSVVLLVSAVILFPTRAGEQASEQEELSFWSRQSFFPTVSVLLLGVLISFATGSHVQATFLAAQPAYRALPETVAYHAVLSDHRAVQGNVSRADLFCLIKAGANNLWYTLPVVIPGPGQLLNNSADSLLVRALSVDPAVRARFQAVPLAALPCVLGFSKPALQ